MNPGDAIDVLSHDRGKVVPNYSRDCRTWFREDAPPEHESPNCLCKVQHCWLAMGVKALGSTDIDLCIARRFSLAKNSTKSTVIPDGPNK